MIAKKFCLVLLCVTGQAFSQSAGVLVGSVTDPSGGGVVGASVTVTDQARNTTYRGVTNENGQYTVTNLEPGTYKVSVERSGFQSATVTDIPLNVNQTARVDIRLNVGEVATSVNVEATTPVVQSETSMIASVVDNRQIQSMPLNGRGNF